jgi:REP element-mobilizing transposase RayT
MPRKARIDAPGALHHIIIRGIERKPIFKDSQDYRNFIERLDIVLMDSSMSCYAWALMPNHVHLLLRTELVSISTVMRRLLTGYAQQFNRRHNRHGHLFQNRYKSILCEEDSYLLELVRYIHLNPLRAGNVENLKDLNSYPFCGHSVLMGQVNHQWHDMNYVLRLFGRTDKIARKDYSSFISKGISLGRRPDLVGGGLIRSHGGWAAIKGLRSDGMRVQSDERILGSSDFVESVLKMANEDLEKKTLALAKGKDLKEIIEVVANHFDLSQRQLKSQSRGRVVARARSIICALAIDRLMMKGAEVAHELNLSPSAVSKLSSRGRADSICGEIEKITFDR